MINRQAGCHPSHDLLAAIIYGHCTICDTPLSAIEKGTGKTCSNLDCKRTHAVKLVLSHEKELKERYQSLAISSYRKISRKRQEPPKNFTLAITPANRKTAHKIPIDRKNAIMRHIYDTALITINEGLIHGEARYAERNQFADFKVRPQDQSALQAACSACRGDCCKTAGNHAYIEPVTFKHIINTNTDISANKILDIYSGYIPAKIIEGAAPFRQKRVAPYRVNSVLISVTRFCVPH